MARIVIDGYNLLPATPCKNRDALLDLLSAYRSRKGHEITVVFDGTKGGTGSGDRRFHGGVEVIFTPLTVTADDEIEEMVGRAGADDMIVVSSDRRIQSAAIRSGATFVYSQEFAARLRGRPEAEIGAEKEDEDEPRPAKKGGNPRKLPKKERRRRRGLDKL